MNEISELTFRPKLSNKLNVRSYHCDSKLGLWSQVPSRLNLKDPEAYMAALREREARRYLKASEAEHKREVSMHIDLNKHHNDHAFIEGGVISLHVPSSDHISPFLHETWIWT